MDRLIRNIKNRKQEASMTGEGRPSAKDLRESIPEFRLVGRYLIQFIKVNGVVYEQEFTRSRKREFNTTLDDSTSRKGFNQSNPGWAIMDNGLMIQWHDYLESNTDSVQSFTFSKEFPRVCYGVFINVKQGGTDDFMSVVSFTTTGFDINRDNAINATHHFNYLAIGF